MHSCNCVDCPSDQINMTDCTNQCYLMNKVMKKEYCSNTCCSKCECACPAFSMESCNRECKKLGVSKGSRFENPAGCSECRCSETLPARDVKHSCPEKQISLQDCTNKCSFEDKVFAADLCSMTCCMECKCRCPKFDASACNALCESLMAAPGSSRNNSVGCTVCRCNGNSNIAQNTICSGEQMSLAACTNQCFLEDKVVDSNHCANQCCSQCQCVCRPFDSNSCNKQCEQIGTKSGVATLNVFGCNVCKCTESDGEDESSNSEEVPASNDASEAKSDRNELLGKGFQELASNTG